MITVSYPWPPKELSPNSRVHWSKKVKFVKQMKEAGYYLTKEAKPIIEVEKPTLSITFNPPTNAKHDMDNCLARCKSLIDGISKAIGIDDSLFQLDLKMGKKVECGNIEVIFWQGNEIREI